MAKVDQVRWLEHENWRTEPGPLVSTGGAAPPVWEMLGNGAMASGAIGGSVAVMGTPAALSAPWPVAEPQAARRAAADNSRTADVLRRAIVFVGYLYSPAATTRSKCQVQPISEKGGTPRMPWAA